MDTGIEGFSENALKILKARYFKKDENGDLIETKPSQLFKRVSKYIANAEKSKADKKFWENKFYKAMMDRDFMPNSPTLTGAGRGLCLSACFVLPVEDSLEKIFETVKNAALVHKEGFFPHPASRQFCQEDPGHCLGACIFFKSHRCRH
jgi:ribonucleoside-diphosphate reductase alpha chain